MKKVLNLNDYAALIGIDWADKKHDICLMDAATEDLEYSQILHNPKAIESWVGSLLSRFHSQRIAIALELKNGPLVNALSRYDNIIIVPISPKALASYRKTFALSGAKDDPTDAYFVLDFLRRHSDKLQAILPDDPDTRTLHRLVEHRRTLVGEKVRLTNRLTAALKEYYPQVLEWFDDIDTVVFCDFVCRWPTFAQVKRARATTLEQFFYQHNVRRRHVIEARLDAIKAAIPLTLDPGVIAPNQFYVVTQVTLLKEVLAQIKHYDNCIAERFKRHPDANLFQSLPGAGAVYAPRLLVAMGSNRDRYQSSDEIARIVGVAPVLERSGQHTWVHWRRSCPRFIRQTFVEWANKTLPHSFWAKVYYEQQYAKGKSHQTILRSLAFKWLRILFRCWKNRVPYNEPTYLLSLKRKGSPLVAMT